MLPPAFSPLVETADDALSPEATHQDELWLCLGFAPRRLESAGAPSPADLQVDVTDRGGKVVVRTGHSDASCEAPPAVLHDSSVRQPGAPTAGDMGNLAAGTCLIVQSGGSGLGTFTARGSKAVYQHPGCLTGRCVPPGRLPCLCPCTVCGNARIR
jgi:hypothetical protein